MRASHELNSDGQAILRQSTRQRNGRTAGERDDECEKHPIDVGRELLAGDLGRKPLLNRERRNGNGGAGKQIIVIEEPRDAMKQPVTLPAAEMISSGVSC